LLKISPLRSGVNVIEIVYDIYAISNSGPPRDAYPSRQARVTAQASNTKKSIRGKLLST
jgi:hypothetical protein